MDILSLGIVTLLIVIAFWLLERNQQRRWQEFEERQRSDPSYQILTQWLQEMRGSLDRNTEMLQRQLDSTNRAIGDRLDNAARVISQVSKELGQVQEIGRQIKEFQDLLRTPKLRGQIGEQILRELLEQILPRNNFQLQYRFSQGQIVDATISTDKGLIPIDAKFPLENFKKFLSASTESEKQTFLREFVRDVRKHIDSVSAKYILPQEGTVDFALIYIPSEAIYYEILMNGDNLNTYAYNKKVLLVSPNIFYYFLKVILIGLEGRRIEEASQRILRALSAIRLDTEKVAENLITLKTHLTNAKNAMERVNSDFLRLTNKIEDTKYLGDGQAKA
ncbi:MAG: DNA recombination protein RmuC [candidate division KSB1 bacterium]|nr:DNA recombination protein RmuC [candidate division KSB1 bacterium]